MWSINNVLDYSGKKLSLYSGKILDFEERRGFNIILTGSNARLLGKELATALTGEDIFL